MRLPGSESKRILTSRCTNLDLRLRALAIPGMTAGGVPRYDRKLHNCRNVSYPEPNMPKAYWITFYREISDPDKLAAYAKLAPPATTPFGARYLCRGLPQAVYEHGQKERVVITEFPSLDKAIAAHDCPAYQEAVRVLGDGAVRDVRIIEGAE